MRSQSRTNKKSRKNTKKPLKISVWQKLERNESFTQAAAKQCKQFGGHMGKIALAFVGFASTAAALGHPLITKTTLISGAVILLWLAGSRAFCRMVNTG